MTLKVTYIVNSIIPATTSNWIYVMLCFRQRASEATNNKTMQYMRRKQPAISDSQTA